MPVLPVRLGRGAVRRRNRRTVAMMAAGYTG
jgi:hypothetical protein